jgi:hypothetical protein
MTTKQSHISISDGESYLNTRDFVAYLDEWNRGKPFNHIVIDVFFALIYNLRLVPPPRSVYTFRTNFYHNESGDFAVPYRN